MPRFFTCGIAALSLALLSVAVGIAQAPADNDALLRELRAFNDALLQAEQQKDIAAMERMIAPDFSWVSFQGAMYGRQQRLGAVNTGRRSPATPQTLAATARWISRDVAILVSTERQLLGIDAERRTRDVHITRVYRRGANSWELVAQHATEAPPKP